MDLGDANVQTFLQNVRASAHLQTTIAGVLHNNERRPVKNYESKLHPFIVYPARLPLPADVEARLVSFLAAKDMKQKRKAKDGSSSASTKLVPLLHHIGVKMKRSLVVP